MSKSAALVIQGSFKRHGADHGDSTKKDNHRNAQKSLSYTIVLYGKKCAWPLINTESLQPADCDEV